MREFPRGLRDDIVGRLRSLRLGRRPLQRDLAPITPFSEPIRLPEYPKGLLRTPLAEIWKASHKTRNDSDKYLVLLKSPTPRNITLRTVYSSTFWAYSYNDGSLWQLEVQWSVLTLLHTVQSFRAVSRAWVLAPLGSAALEERSTPARHRPETLTRDLDTPPGPAARQVLLSLIAAAATTLGEVEMEAETRIEV